MTEAEKILQQRRTLCISNFLRAQLKYNKPHFCWYPEQSSPQHWELPVAIYCYNWYATLKDDTAHRSKVCLRWRWGAQAEPVVSYRPIHRSIQSSSAGGAESHLIDLQSSAADRWLQAVIKNVKTRICVPSLQQEQEGNRDNLSCHIFKFTVSGFTVSTGTEHTHILLRYECNPSLCVPDSALSEHRKLMHETASTLSRSGRHRRSFN